MCNAASVEMRGQDFAKNFEPLTQSDHGELFPS
jgi:hypothetical protein